jgi:alpha-amylase
MILQTYRFFEILENHYYYDDYENEYNIKNISEKMYLPANKIILDLIHFSKSSFKISFLFSGVVLDQFELYAPEMIDNYRTLLDTGCVDLLSGTYSNPIGPLSCIKRYYNQIKLQNARIKSVFRKDPLAFNSGDIHNCHNRLIDPGIRLLTGNGKLLSNISNKITGKNQNNWLLKPGKLLRLLKTCQEKGEDTVYLFIPYHIFRGFQNGNTSILEFLESFPGEVISRSDYIFGIPSGREGNFRSFLQAKSSDEISGETLELFYESCNELQKNAFEKLYYNSALIDNCNDHLIYKDWLYLQSCDHFYFMNQDLYDSIDSNRIFLPYNSQYFAYINYMNILTDFSYRVKELAEQKEKKRKTLNSKHLKDYYSGSKQIFMATTKVPSARKQEDNLKTQN